MNQKEEFRPIKGLKGYWAGDEGHIMSTKRKEPKIMSVTTAKNGYPMVALWHEGQLYTLQVNRLILESFVDYPADPWLCVVRHRDGDRNNCSLDNLEWYVCETTNEYDPSISTRRGVLKPDFTKERMSSTKMHQSRETIEKQVRSRRTTMERLNYWRRREDD